MNVRAWCGLCGQSFDLSEVVAPAHAGRCPRCGELLAPDYTAVLTSAVRRLLAALAAIDDAAGQLGDVAPRLHIDTRRLYAALDALDTMPKGDTTKGAR